MPSLEPKESFHKRQIPDPASVESAQPQPGEAGANPEPTPHKPAVSNWYWSTWFYAHKSGVLPQTDESSDVKDPVPSSSQVLTPIDSREIHVVCSQRSK